MGVVAPVVEWAGAACAGCRLGVGTREHQWEGALNAGAALRAYYERFVTAHPCRLSPEQR